MTLPFLPHGWNDGRTRINRRLWLAGTAAASAALGYAGGRFYPPGNYSMPAYRAGRYLRKRRGRATAARRTRRRVGRGKRGYGPRRGRRYTRNVKRPNRRLNVNFSRNDYLTQRRASSSGSFQVIANYSLTGNTFAAPLTPAGLGINTTTFPGQYFDEFKIVGLQWVITPTFSIKDSDVHFDAAEGRSLLVRCTDGAFTPSVPNHTDLHFANQTPGYTKIPVLKTSRTVINDTIRFFEDMEIKQNNGSIKVTKRIPNQWIKMDSTTDDTVLSRLEVVRPEITLGTTADLSYDVRCYATCKLRGLKNDTIAPS